MQRLLVLPVVAVLLTACSDPAKDAVKATVADVAPSSAPAATAPAAIPVAATPPAAGDARSAFSQDGSTIGFVGSKVTGSADGVFKTFAGTIDVPGGKLELGKVAVTIEMASVDVPDSEKLAGHLKSPDFFDVAKFPQATFTSTSVAPGEGGKSTVTGDFTLHGVTKSISFPATVKVSPAGTDVAAEFAINRKDFGILYPGKADDLIRDDVVIKLDVHAK